MIKGFFKFILFVIFLNFVLSFVFLSWFSAVVLFPAFRDSGIKFTEVFTGLPPRQYETLSQEVVSKAAMLGQGEGAKLSQGLANMFEVKPMGPSSSVPNYTKAYKAQVDAEMQSAAQRGISEGLQKAQELNTELTSVKKKSLAGQ